MADDLSKTFRAAAAAGDVVVRGLGTSAHGYYRHLVTAQKPALRSLMLAVRNRGITLDTFRRELAVEKNLMRRELQTHEAIGYGKARSAQKAFFAVISRAVRVNRARSR